MNFDYLSNKKKKKNPESESKDKNIPQSITSKDKKLKGAVNLFLLKVP
jgi:hypothetical protein